MNRRQFLASLAALAPSTYYFDVGKNLHLRKDASASAAGFPQYHWRGRMILLGTPPGGANVFAYSLPDPSSHAYEGIERSNFSWYRSEIF